MLVFMAIEDYIVNYGYESPDVSFLTNEHALLNTNPLARRGCFGCRCCAIVPSNILAKKTESLLWGGLPICGVPYNPSNNNLTIDRFGLFAHTFLAPRDLLEASFGESGDRVEIFGVDDAVYARSHNPYYIVLRTSADCSSGFNVTEEASIEFIARWLLREDSIQSNINISLIESYLSGV